MTTLTLIEFLHAIKISDKPKFYLSEFVNTINTIIDTKLTYKLEDWIDEDSDDEDSDDEDSDLSKKYVNDNKVLIINNGTNQITINHIIHLENIVVEKTDLRKVILWVIKSGNVDL
jgi:hypothetical protein